MNTDEFKSQCQNSKSINDATEITLLGKPINEPKCSNKNFCEVQIEGGNSLFCDICTVTYNSKTNDIIETEWVFGDD